MFTFRSEEKKKDISREAKLMGFTASPDYSFQKHYRNHIITYNRKKTPPLRLEEYNTFVEMSILLKAIRKLNVVAIKIPMAFSTEPEKTITKFIWKETRFRIHKAVLCKKNKGEAS